MKRIIAKLLKDPKYPSVPNKVKAHSIHVMATDLATRIVKYGLQDYWEDILTECEKPNPDLSFVGSTDELLAVENGSVIRVSKEYFLHNEEYLLGQYHMQLSMINMCVAGKNITSPIGIVNKYNFPYVRLRKNIKNFRNKIAEKYGEKNLLLIENQN